MNVKKAIKKVIALGAGLTMIGATIMGASALTLSDYPQPFVKDGVFGGKIIVGQAASPADVIGAIDISASLQAAAKTVASTGGAATATTTVSGGILLDDGNNQDFNYGDRFSSSDIDEQDFPTILADGVLEDDDGTDYDFSQDITVGNYTLKYDLVDNDVYSDPVMYLDLDDATATGYLLTFTLDFDSGDEVDWTLLDDSEELNMFGTTWTIKNIATGGDVILFGSDLTKIVTLNNPVDVESDGKTYTLNVVGANSDDSTVQVSVNGDVKSLSEGDTKTISGLDVYVEDVFISNVAGDSASAKLFVGSKELNLGSTFGSWKQVQVDSEDLDGVEVYMTGSDTAVSKIQFRIDTTDIANADTDEDYDWLAMGDTFVDPLFGFKVSFTEAVPDFMASSRDYVDFQSSSDDFVVTFTNNDGVEYEFSPYQLDSGSNLKAGEDFNFAAQNQVAKDAIFILEEDSSSSEPVSRVFEFRNADLSDDEADFKDLGTGNTLTIGSGDTLADTGVTVTIDADDVINLSAASKAYVYTASGAKMTFTTAASAATQNVTIVEDEKGVNKDEITGDTFTVAVTYDSTDNEVNVAKPASWSGGSDDDDDNNYNYGVSTYGTFYKQESDENTQLEMWFPMEDVDYNVYLAPSDSQLVTSTGATSGSAYNVNPIAVGIAVLDVNAPALGSTPMIIVGGPCANTVAAEVMGAPDPCGEGFEAGKAVIKWYDDKSALLVAGYEATETQGASRVLADYADYGLTGTEVEVVVPTLSSISINKVA